MFLKRALTLIALLSATLFAACDQGPGDDDLTAAPDVTEERTDGLVSQLPPGYAGYIDFTCPEIQGCYTACRENGRGDGCFTACWEAGDFPGKTADDLYQSCAERNNCTTGDCANQFCGEFANNCRQPDTRVQFMQCTARGSLKHKDGRIFRLEKTASGRSQAEAGYYARHYCRLQGGLYYGYGFSGEAGDPCRVESCTVVKK